MTLDIFLQDNNTYVSEGYIEQIPEQVNILKEIVNNNKIINILEIGFNAGHSACLFLENNKQCNVVSFDIGTHNYTNIGKKYIDNTYPDRHKLIIGDSKITIPSYINAELKQINSKQFEFKTFDLIFIDGGHDYDTALADLLNCKILAHKDTIVIMDDTIINNNENVADWNIGPTKAWNIFKDEDLIKELITYIFSFGRGMSIGKYLL